MAEPAAASPLAGTTVVEVSSTVAAAYCGLLLRQLGATVLRPDSPLVADCPPELAGALAESLGVGKTALSDPAAVRAAVAHADLVVSDRAAASPTHEVHALWDLVDAATPPNVPRIEITVTDGAAGTWATASAAAGMSWAIGHPDQAPLPLPTDLPGYHAGAEAAAMASLALLVPARGEEGWRVSAEDVLIYYTGQIASNFLPYERPWRRDGARASLSGGSYPAAMFACSDGWVSIMCRTQQDWNGLVTAMGSPDWALQPRFRDPRVVARHHADEADRHLSAWLAGRTRDQVFALGQEHRFPIAPVLTPTESLILEQFAHRDFLASQADGLLVPGPPWRLHSPERPTRERGSSWTPSATAPLAGLRVLDLSWAWSGPMVTSGLQDLGATVYKIESRTRPDPTRVRGPAIRGGHEVPGPALETTPYFNQVNHGKHSVAIDLSTSEGADLVRSLAGRVDVVVENMRPGVLDRRGLGYGDLSANNPGLVMLSMSLMGQDGPMRAVGGYAPVMSGLSGLDSTVGYGPDDLVGLFNPALGDPNGASHGMACLLAALVDRRRSGRGRHIDLSQVEALVAIQRAGIVEAQRTGKNRVPANSHAVFHPHGAWRCAGEDEWVVLAARTDTERRNLAELVNCRLDDHDDLDRAVAVWALARTAAQAEHTLLDAGLPARRVRSFEDVQEAPEVRARDTMSNVPHRFLGQQLLVSLPWEAGGRRFPARSPAPLLGADTRAVLGRELGLGDQEVDDLAARGVVECATPAEASRRAV